MLENKTAIKFPCCSTAVQQPFSLSTLPNQFSFSLLPCCEFLLLLLLSMGSLPGSESDPSSTPTEGIFTIGWQDFPIQRIFKPSATYNNLTRSSKYSSALSLFNMTCAVQNHLFTTGSCAMPLLHLSRAPSNPTELRQTLHTCSHHSSLLPTSQATLAKAWLGCFQSCLDG